MEGPPQYHGVFLSIHWFRRGNWLPPCSLCHLKPAIAEQVQTTEVGSSVPIQVDPIPTHLVSVSYGHANSYCPRSLAGGLNQTGADTINALAMLQLRTETRRKKRTKRRRLPATEQRMYYGQEQFESNQYHPISRPSTKMRYRMTFKKPGIAPNRGVSTTPIFNHECQHDPSVQTEAIYQIDTEDVSMDDHSFEAQIKPLHTNPGNDDQIPTH